MDKGISVMGAGRVTGMGTGNRHKVPKLLSRSSRAHRGEAA